MSDQSKTCFLIDDDEDDREIFQMALDDLNGKFSCVMSDNCMDALDRLREGNLHPDYIFLDLNMPVVTGRECLVEIRKMHQFDTTPVLIYSTSSVPSDIDDMMKLGATSFITKPNKISVLTNVLKEVLTAS
jgi:CheY-like chemotaxis protein